MRSAIRAAVSSALLLSAVSLSTPAALPAGWSIFDLDGTRGEADAVSDSGIVVGCSAVGTKSRAIIWSNGVSRELEDLPADSDSCAHAVNNAGMAAGVIDAQAAVWSNGHLLRLPVAGIANGVNESGVVVGTYKLGSEANAPTHAFMWRDGVLTDLHPAAARTSTAAAINDAGQIAGTIDSRVVVWENGTPRELGFEGSVGAINDRAEVVGLHTFGNANRAQPYVFNGALSPLAGGAQGDLSALAITNGGRVLVNGVDDYATVIEGGRRLSLELMSTTREVGWKRLEPRGMNDRGWIVGYGNHDGLNRKFLIVPEDGAIAGNAMARAATRTVPLVRIRGR